MAMLIAKIGFSALLVAFLWILIAAAYCGYKDQNYMGID